MRPMTVNGGHSDAPAILGWLLAAGIAWAGMVPALAQVSEEERAAREAQQRQIETARQFEANKRQITVFDLDGNLIDTVGEPDVYSEPAVSSGRGRIAVVRSDPQAESSEIVILDAETGETSRIAEGESGQFPPTLAFSPDGRALAFAALRGSRFNIYRRPLDGAAEGEGELVYSHDGGPIMLADWSPDGRYLAFSSSVIDSEGRLYVIDLEEGGEPVVVARGESPMILPRFSPDGRYLSYLLVSQAGVEHYAARAAPSPGGGQESWRLTSNNTSSEGFWDADDPVYYHIDNNRRLMAVSLGTGGAGLEAGEERHVATLPETVPENNVLGMFAMSRDAERLVFTLPRQPEPQRIAVFDRHGAEIVRLGEPGRYDLPSFSPDGSRILALRGSAATAAASATAVLTFDLASGAVTQVAGVPPGFIQVPAWMGDGEHIAYSTLPAVPAFGDHSWIYRKRADGQGEEEVLYRSTTGVLLTLMDVSPGGEYLMFDSSGWVAAVPLTGDDPLQREPVDLLRAEFEASAARFSPDMRHVAYIYNESGRPEVYVAPFDAETGTAGGGGRRQISRDGAAGALDWRADGREFYYLSEMLDTPELNDFRVMAVSVAPEPELETGEPRALFEVTLPRTLTTQGVSPAGTGTLPLWQNASPDGRRFVFVLPASGGE